MANLRAGPDAGDDTAGDVSGLFRARYPEMARLADLRLWDFPVPASALAGRPRRPGRAVRQLSRRPRPVTNVEAMATTIALITGANKGIGFETARQLGARGGHRGRRRRAQPDGSRRDARGLRDQRVRRDRGDERDAAAAAPGTGGADRQRVQRGRLDHVDTPVKVNAASPGYTATDLNRHNGFRSVAEGAEATVHLATLGPDGPSGILWGHLWTADGPADAYGPLPW
jgi:hypothetical protein